jgi:hypothetical protein
MVLEISDTRTTGPFTNHAGTRLTSIGPMHRPKFVRPMEITPSAGRSAEVVEGPRSDTQDSGSKLQFWSSCDGLPAIPDSFLGALLARADYRAPAGHSATRHRPWWYDFRFHGGIYGPIHIRNARRYFGNFNRSFYALKQNAKESRHAACQVDAWMSDTNKEVFEWRCRFSASCARV